MLRAALKRSSGNSVPVNHSVPSSGAKWQLCCTAGFKLSFLREEGSLKLKKFTRLTRVCPAGTGAGNSCWGGVAACRWQSGSSVTWLSGLTHARSTLVLTRDPSALTGSLSWTPQSPFSFVTIPSETVSEGKPQNSYQFQETCCSNSASFTCSVSVLDCKAKV